MITRRKIYSLVAATLLVSASQAGTQPPGTPAYLTKFYNNAAHQTQVGMLMWNGCSETDEPHYRLVGIQTSYHEDELAGYCIDGQMSPIY